VLAVVTAAALARAGDDGAEFVRRCLLRHAEVQSYACRVLSTFAYCAGDERREQRAAFRLSVSLPNRLAYVPESADLLPRTVCDGARLWQTLPSRKEYVESPAPPSLTDVVLDVRDMGRLSPVLSGLCLRFFTDEGRRALVGEADRVRTLGRSEIGGRECERVRLIYTGRGMILDLWVEPKTLMLRRLQLDLSAEIARQYGLALEQTRVVVQEDYEEVTVEAEAPQPAFRFTPPDGWRRVEELNRGEVEAVSEAARSLVGRRAPAIALWNASGDVVQAPVTDGRPAVLLFWREGEVSGLAADVVDSAYRRYAPLGVRFLAVHVGRSPKAKDPGETAERLVDLVRRRGYVMPVAFDRRGLGAASYQVADLPTAAVIDGAGTLRHLYAAAALGFRRRLWGELDALLRR